MKANYKAILFLQYFGTGVMQPVLALMLLSRGCTLQTLPLVLMAYGGVTLLLELPSGIYADHAGRKRTFLLSIGFYCLHFILLLLSHSFWGVLAAMVLEGAGRAFASGSIDALIVDDFVETHGEEQLPVVTSQMSVIIGVGIASGALAGGLLPMWRAYSLHLGLRLLLLAALGLLCAATVREKSRKAVETREKHTLLQLSGIRFTGPLIRLLLSILMLTSVMMVVETYWAPNLKAMDPGSANGLLGLLSAASFGMLTLGSIAAGKLRVSGVRARFNLLFTLRLLLAGTAVLMGLCRSPWAFSAAFILFYTLLGVDDVEEQTLLNTLADSGNRAATLSAGSLMAQLGGLGASAVCSVAIGPLGMAGLWVGAGVISAVVCAVLWLISAAAARKNTQV